MQNRYEKFLQSKKICAKSLGFDVKRQSLNPLLFEYQKDVVLWALRKGRVALFEDCGLGKTVQQLEWSKQVEKKTKKPVLILAPLAVSHQTKKESESFGYDVNVVESHDEINERGIYITNYEKLHRFNPSCFAGVVLDESSILKSFDGKTRKMLTESFEHTPYKLACTATPAPNDHVELGTHAEFLGVMSRVEMLATFFVHDGADTSKWRLKGHAEEEFWKWLCSWAVTMRKPSDLGYSDDGFILPELRIHHHIITSEFNLGGFLFPMKAKTMAERRDARKSSLDNRVSECVTLVNSNNEQWLVWCDFNKESELLSRQIRDAVEVTGSDKDAHKKDAMLGFTDNKHRVLVSKPSICGFGMNWQNCHNVAFVGLSDSYEQFYQAVRRVWRFGQKESVHCHIFFSEAESSVIKNIERKEREAHKMADEMVKQSSVFSEVHSVNNTQNVKYKTDKASGEKWTLMLGDCVEHIKEIQSESIDYSIFSPPFASLYTYTNSERDMGNCRNDNEFIEHFDFLVKELFRVIKSGRLLSFHCMNLPSTKERDGFIGIKDFRGQLIKMFQDAGFIFHSEVVIWKDPVTAMQRTKAIGLLYKQLKKDSTISRQGIPDYLVTMRKPGVNSQPVTKTPDEFPVNLWQRYASPVWFDINPSNTLQRTSAREDKDERHICPLQLEVIERALQLWTNPNDLVLSPFAGIGSEGFSSIKLERRFIGIELKQSYYEQAVRNLHNAALQTGSLLEFLDDVDDEGEVAA